MSDLKSSTGSPFNSVRQARQDGTESATERRVSKAYAAAEVAAERCDMNPTKDNFAAWADAIEHLAVLRAGVESFEVAS